MHVSYGGDLKSTHRGQARSLASHPALILDLFTFCDLILIIILTLRKSSLPYTSERKITHNITHSHGIRFPCYTKDTQLLLFPMHMIRGCVCVSPSLMRSIPFPGPRHLWSAVIQCLLKEGIVGFLFTHLS